MSVEQLSPQVLVVDDNAVNRLVAQRLLEKMRWEVECADGGIAAVQAFARGKFDLILMDIHMPEMDGYETSQYIRKIEDMNKKAATLIIALTAGEIDKEKCDAAGMNGWLQKPLYRNLLEEYLAQYRLLPAAS